ncbi:hypothetical protein FOA52_011958 [Chlamydomonas sp. UWO 241]|nr:hypothetical protein FOA52_011958 [Chlamydomonas sp. UWO 241]
MAALVTMEGSVAAASQGTFDVTLGCLMSTPLPRLVHASGQVLKATAVYRVKTRRPASATRRAT